MKQQANLIRAGQVIEHDGNRWTVLKQQIITPGKGGAFIQVEMRNLKSGNKTNERWRTADTVERLTTEEKEYTYSYSDGINLVLMDPDTYEETHVRSDLMGDAAPFLQDQMTVTVDLVEGDPVGIRLPPSVTLEVVEADPWSKARPRRPPTNPRNCPTASRPWCPRSSSPANASWSAPRTAATWSAPRAEGVRPTWPKALPAHHRDGQRRAESGQRLLRDFAEVEQLQVSIKGPSDFVSQADIRAEQTLKED